MDETIDQSVGTENAGVATETPMPVQPNPVSAEEPAQTQAATPATEQTSQGLMGEEGAAEAALAAAPDAYSFDGLEVGEDYELDQPTAEEFAKIAKEVNLSQEGFNTVFNKLMPYLNQRQEEQLQELRGQFLEEAKSNPEIGGAKFNENLATARKAFKQFVDPETQELLAASGLDCHPGLIRAFVNIGRAISNDTVVRGTAPQQRDAAKAFFNNSDMN